VDLTVSALRKRYGSNAVLKGIDVTFRAGEVHALLGPNGAGKSTLLGCLSGAVTPDSGTMRIGDDEFPSFTPSSAFAAGTAIIYQHLQLVCDLSVADNVFLGQELTGRTRSIRSRSQKAIARKIVRDLGLHVDPSTLLGDLSMGEQQVVAIARALRHEPSILILDEPTAALSTDETQRLLVLIRKLAVEKRMTIIYVTHLLREVLEVADVATVMRDGQILWSRRVADLQFEDLVEGIAPLALVKDSIAARARGSVLLGLEEFGSSRAGSVTLELHGGEIFGLFGLLGSGRTDLLECIAGVRRSRAGSMCLAGEPVSAGSPRSAQNAGIALVPSDRQIQALFGDMRADENVLMPNYGSLSPLWRRRRSERVVFDRVASRVGLAPPRPDLLASEFSGGNGQKIAVGRWLTGLDDISVLLLDEPTQGVDVGARQDLYGLFRNYVAGLSRSILFASSDPEEVVALADRVAVLVDGRVVAIVSPEVGETELVALAHGGSADAAKRWETLP